MRVHGEPEVGPSLGEAVAAQGDRLWPAASPQPARRNPLQHLDSAEQQDEQPAGQTNKHRQNLLW